MNKQLKGEITMKYEINVEDNGNKNFETVKDLMEMIDYEKCFSAKNYQKFVQFLNSKIKVQLLDINGTIISGDVILVVGMVEEGSFLLTGNIQEVYE